MKINAILLSDWQDKRGIIHFEQVSMKSFCEIKKKKNYESWKMWMIINVLKAARKIDSKIRGKLCEKKGKIYI